MRACASSVILSFVATILMAVATSGCGVRGRPQPPLEPPQIGRGKPTFTNERLAFPEVAPVPSPTPFMSSTSQPQGKDR